MKTFLGLFSLVVLPMTAPADEGMWLFNKPPTALLKQKYDFAPDAKWLEHVQKASVRFNSGGSGSFVSADGLVMTNHHVGADAIQKLSTKESNYLEDGFHAKSRDAELKCVDLELNVLMSIEVVTGRVKAAVKGGATTEEAFKARREAIAAIEKESLDKTGLRSNVVTLYQGGEYHLYRFKRYTDIRLAFAPEQQAAFFGGDPDNFEYPRYCLDVCFFRVYEDGKPVKPEHHLSWSDAGAKEGELVFVSGHPGRTNRLNTVAELEYLRDHGFPFLLQRLYRWEVLLSVFSSESAEQGRMARDELFGIENSRKARNGGLAGLLDPEIMAGKRQKEAELRKAASGDAVKAWGQIAAAMKKRAEVIRPYSLLEGGSAFHTIYFDLGRTLLRAGDEKPKANGERLREFQDSNLPSLEQQLFSGQPIHDDLERTKLADGLTLLAQEYGADDELVQKILAGKSPRDRAAELIAGTKLKDVALRKKLYEGGADAVKAANDPMVELARLVDAASRELREAVETDIDEVKRQAYGQIAEVKYQVEGDSVYPDATFTLRLAFGTVKGYEKNGETVPPETTMAGLYRRAESQGNRPPFNVPESWIKAKDKLDLATPFNFVCTADIIGGNSGSPVINKDGEVVGLIFDGNIESLVLDFVFTEKKARAVSVHSQAIIEALKKVYGAEKLVSEILGSGKNAGE